MRSAYALYDPRQPELMRYVGVAVDPNARLKTHIYDGGLYGRAGYEAARHEWLYSLLCDGVTPGLRLIEEVDEVRAGEREKYWIVTLKASGHPLVNASAGGQVRRLGPSDITIANAQREMRRAEKAMILSVRRRSSTHVPPMMSLREFLRGGVPGH